MRGLLRVTGVVWVLAIAVTGLPVLLRGEQTAHPACHMAFALGPESTGRFDRFYRIEIARGFSHMLSEHPADHHNITSQNITHYDVSADGETLIYTDGQRLFRGRVRPVVIMTELLHERLNADYVALSPDENTVAYINADGIHLLSLDTRVPRLLFANRPLDDLPYMQTFIGLEYIDNDHLWVQLQHGNDRDTGIIDLRGPTFSYTKRGQSDSTPISGERLLIYDYAYGRSLGLYIAPFADVQQQTPVSVDLADMLRDPLNTGGVTQTVHEVTPSHWLILGTDSATGMLHSEVMHYDVARRLAYTVFDGNPIRTADTWDEQQRMITQMEPVAFTPDGRYLFGFANRSYRSEGVHMRGRGYLYDLESGNVRWLSGSAPPSLLFVRWICD